MLDGNDFLPAIAGLLTLMFASAAFPAMLLSLLWIVVASTMLTVARGRTQAEPVGA